jgi:hypothetical protein
MSNACPIWGDEMQAEATETQTSSDAPGAVTRYGKARFLTLADLDQRTGAYRETVKLIAEMEVDLGGADELSSGERQLVQRAGVLGAVLSDIETRWIGGEPIDVAAYCTTVNAQRRVLETIGLRRRARDVTPSLQAYLRDKAAPAPEASS